MRLMVSSPEGVLLDVSGADWVNIRLIDGNPISVYANHAPLVALHSACDLKFRVGDEVFIQRISKGVLSISGNTVKCLVEVDAPQLDEEIYLEEENKQE